MLYLNSSAGSQRPCYVAVAWKYIRDQCPAIAAIGPTQFLPDYNWQGLMHSARHVIGCRLIQDTRVRNASDDMASAIHQSLTTGSARPPTTTSTNH
jgi:hypothetical protein